MGCNSWIPEAQRPPPRRLCSMRNAKPLRVRLAAGRADAKAQCNANAMPARLAPRPKTAQVLACVLAAWHHRACAAVIAAAGGSSSKPCHTHARMARTHSAGINASTARKNTPTSTSIAAVRCCRRADCGCSSDDGARAAAKQATHSTPVFSIPFSSEKAKREKSNVAQRRKGCTYHPVTVSPLPISSVLSMATALECARHPTPMQGP